MPAEIQIRRGTEREWSLAFDSFIEEYRDSPAAQGCSRGTLSALFGSYLAQWRYLVACEPETPEEIMGFIVASSQGAVAWIQVKHQYRKLGVASALLDAAAVTTGKVLTPFLPGGALNAQLRAKGYHLCHRPWMVP